jgi:hypothetical protein
MMLFSRRFFPSVGRTALIISVAALFLTGASASRTASEVTQEPAPGFQSLEGRKIVVLLRDRMDEPDEESRLPLSAGELAWLANTVGVDLEPAGQTRDGGQVLTVMGPLAEGAVREALGDMRLLGHTNADINSPEVIWEFFARNRP